MMIEIIRGEILSIDIPSRVLVDWDGIIHATHEDSGISKVFFIGTKEIANEKDIFREGKGLFDRSKRTYDYLQQLKMKATMLRVVFYSSPYLIFLSSTSHSDIFLQLLTSL